MQHFIQETLPLILFGVAGILIMLFIKINDINKKPENDALTWSQTMQKFFRKEWASYIVSFLIVLVTAFSHEEWLQWFSPEGKIGKFVEIPFGVKLGMTAWGMVGHYLLYKFWLGKLDKQ